MMLITFGVCHTIFQSNFTRFSHMKRKKTISYSEYQLHRSFSNATFLRRTILLLADPIKSFYF